MNNNWPGDVDADDDEAFDLAAIEKMLDAKTPKNEQKYEKQNEPKIIAEFDGFDSSAGNNWIYPSNLPMRSYQHNIVQSALYKNTLVVLPTGLGKTFIASVVMYNLHRWFPRGKLIFMAPTRPLVSQQIAACHKIMPLPASDAVELTGRLPRAKRAELWRSKRVFFATPQVVQSDMLQQQQADGFQFPYQDIKLLVVDEAHRAKGRYAYTQVTESIMARNPHFRMLALSATPGRTMEDVAAVCRNLYISHLEVRCEESIDVRSYVHQRSLRTVVVPLKDRIKEPRARLLQIIDPYLRQLIAANVLKGARGNISRNNLLYDQARFMDRAASEPRRHPEHSEIVGNFAMCISLYYALELLERHGLRVFVNNFEADDKGRDKFVLRDAALRELVEQVRRELGANPLDHSTHTMTNGQVAAMPATLDFGHPKYEQARQVLLQHFESQSESRAIVFCEYRESVMLIQRLLLQHRPLLRPRCFVGQSSNGGGICALTQKEQLQVMSDFRGNVCNVLVATSIGEEGLDVGEVDLIVCFDICSSNPTRFVQRIGRTGRKRQGAVVMLVTEGREQQLLKEVLASKDQTNRKLHTSTLIKASLYPNAPRLVPPQFQPRCEQRFMEAATATPTPTKSKTPSPKAKAKARKQPVRCQDLRKYFKQSQDSFQQDQPAYKPSEATQQMLQAKLAQQPIAIDDFLQSSPVAAAAAPIPVLEESQRLRKLQRLLHATKPLISEAQRSQELVAQLQDKQLPQPLKFYLLECNVAFVRETHAKMQQQQQLQHAEARLNTRQQRTRRIHELLQDVCQGQLEQLLQTETNSAELNLKDLRTTRMMRNQSALFEDIFKDLPERGLCADNSELVQQQLEQLEQRQLELTISNWQQLDNETVEDHWDTQLEESCQENASLYQSQWQDNKTAGSSTPLRHVQQEPTPRQDACLLASNLSRLNCLMSAASTPLARKQLQPDCLLAELDENLSAFEALKEQPEAMLDLDLKDFLEPLPEEQLLQTTPRKNVPRNRSPDLFADESSSPWRPKAIKTPPSKQAQSPQRAAGSQAAVLERSPSIFESYLRGMRGRGQLSKEAQRIHRMTSLAVAQQEEQPQEEQEQEQDSPIVRRRPAKRKIYDISDGEEEPVPEPEQEVLCTQLLADDSFEQVPATQLPPRRNRRKRLKCNPFVLQEAAQSGSDDDEDEEAEHTIGAYLKDSVIVSSDDEQHQHHNDTNAHAMYLQATRSPLHRPGAFKLPAPRVFNDSSIYSQDVEAEPSQYYPCSFVVSDESSTQELSHDRSECPLERAERILKEQRKQRRRGEVQIPPTAGRSKRRRIQMVSDSSEDDDVILVND